MQLILIMLIGIDVCDRMVFLWEETGVPSETHLSDLVTTWLSHMPTPGIEPGSQRWEASALTLRQPDSLSITDLVVAPPDPNAQNVLRRKRCNI